MSRIRWVAGPLHFPVAIWMAAIFLAMTCLSGCGYSLQNSHNPLAEKEGVRKIYVSPLVNNSYQPGVENLVYNALVRTLSAHRRVVLVSDPGDADAVLNGTIIAATSVGTALAVPANLGRSITSQYTATLSCSFDLIRRNPPPGKRGIIWNGSFIKTRPYSSAMQVGPRGTTTALINGSEFERTLADLADVVVEDVHESMLAIF